VKLFGGRECLGDNVTLVHNKGTGHTEGVGNGRAFGLLNRKKYGVQVHGEKSGGSKHPQKGAKDKGRKKCRRRKGLRRIATLRVASDRISYLDWERGGETTEGGRSNRSARKRGKRTNEPIVFRAKVPKNAEQVRKRRTHSWKIVKNWGKKRRTTNSMGLKGSVTAVKRDSGTSKGSGGARGGLPAFSWMGGLTRIFTVVARALNRRDLPRIRVEECR